MSCFVLPQLLFVVCCLNVRFGTHIILFINYLSWGRQRFVFCCHLLVILLFLLKKSSSSWFMEKAGLFYFDTPWTLNITLFLTFQFLKPCTVNQIYCKIISYFVFCITKIKTVILVRTKISICQEGYLIKCMCLLCLFL